MKTCPMCCKKFISTSLDSHIDKCFASQLPSKHSELNNSENNRSTAESQNINFQREIDENINGLKTASGDLRIVLKTVRDIVMKGDPYFHVMAERIYDQFEDDISKFLKNFSEFRKNIRPEKRQSSSENDSLSRSVPKSIAKNNGKESRIHSEINQTDLNHLNHSNPSESTNFDQNLINSSKNDQNLLNSAFFDQINDNQNAPKTIETIPKSIRKSVTNETSEPPQENKCIECSNSMISEGLLINPNCPHKICQFCVCQSFSQNISQKLYEKQTLKCLFRNCKADLDFTLLGFIPGGILNAFSEQQFKFLSETDQSFISCPQCGDTFYREKHEETARMNSFEGVELSLEAQKDLAENRFRCSHCKKDFCASCRTFPYHKGKTCSQLSLYKTSKKCRFCKEMLENDHGRICGKKECLERHKTACSLQLPCGHDCVGVKGHKKCLNCVEEKCTAKSGGLNGGDFCQICWVESIDSAPCVQLDCGHLFHHDCVHTKLEKKWPSARISFGYLDCPLCKTQIQCGNLPEKSRLNKIVQEERKFFETVREMAFKRIEIEGYKNDPKLKESSSRYFNKPREFAMHKFAFYICYKCGKPYFGGKRNCEEALVVNSEKFDKTHLVCGPCSAGPNTKRCLRHGVEFLTFKCKFCCSVANWFCWGKTHFCDNCHKTQVRGNYLTKKKKSSFPKCKGKAFCPLKMDHPPNGTEFSLGCVLCLKK